MYWWEGRLTKSDEIMTIYKLPTENWKKVEEIIQGLHKYEVPCIIKLAEVEANASYEEWVRSEMVIPAKI